MLFYFIFKLHIQYSHKSGKCHKGKKKNQKKSTQKKFMIIFDKAQKFRTF